MKSIGAFVRLTRIEHALMLDIAVLIAIFIGAKAAWAGLPPLETFVLALAVPAFVQMGSFALNDYFDVETDRHNKKKDRPIVSGEVGKQEALWIAIACYLFGNVLAYFLGVGALSIAVVFSVLSIAYNWKLKDIALAGNLYIAATMGIPFVFGSVIVAGEITKAAWVLAVIACIVGLAREIMKTAQDFEGDKKAREAKTLPAYIGVENSLKAAGVLFLLFVPLSYFPFFYGLNANLLSLGMVSVANLALIAIGTQLLMVYKREKEKGKVELLKRGRNASLLSLFVGLVGYLAGAL
ncbi:Digeranylgeranylglyceryl phosphate synthase [Candidatus Anstonella stagnisolia]|nr:Digeranylgeranylglyceryl phosphate synthase [Candidatus Anstonella stagnisolia]